MIRPQQAGPLLAPIVYTLLWQNAQMGRLTGKDVVPEESTAIAGFCTVSVAP